VTRNTALIIDDSRAIRLALSHITQELGFVPQAFPDAESALEWLNGGGTAVLALVDWNMPGMGGLGFIKEARSRSELDGMAIMIVTSDTSQSTMELAFSGGVDEYLMKPITQQSVRSKLQLLGFEWDSAL